MSDRNLPIYPIIILGRRGKNYAKDMKIELIDR